MLTRLLELRPIIEDLGAADPELHLSSKVWRKVQLTADTLAEPTVTTTRLQAADLTPGEFIRMDSAEAPPA